MQQQPYNNPKQAQTFLTVVLGLAGVILIFVMILFNQIRETTYLLKRAQDNEASYFAAGGAIEEAIAQLRKEVNDPSSKFHDFLRTEINTKLQIDLPHSTNLLKSAFTSQFKQVEAWAKVVDLNQIKEQLIADSADRSGHISVSARAIIGSGKALITATMQMRILDMAIPAPLNNYDIVFKLNDSLIGANKQKDGNTDLSRLSLNELRTINNSWHYNLIDKQQIVEHRGIPFVLGRVCRQFSTWAQMQRFHTWRDGNLYFCGDILSSDPNSLVFSNIQINGFGQIFSTRSSITVDGVRFSENAQMLFGILQKGEIKLSRMYDPEIARFSIYLPEGRLSIDKGTRFKGFAFVQGDNSAEGVDVFQPEPSLKKLKTFVSISGQVMLWQNERD